MLSPVLLELSRDWYRIARPTAWSFPGRDRLLRITTRQFNRAVHAVAHMALPTAHSFQEYWGYLYHLDAMQQVSFPDINKNPTTQGVAPPCKNPPIPGVPEVPGAVDPQTTVCLTPPRAISLHASPPTARKGTRRAMTRAR
jgi:arylsulfatase